MIRRFDFSLIAGLFYRQNLFPVRRVTSVDIDLASLAHCLRLSHSKLEKKGKDNGRQDFGLSKEA